MEQDQTQKELNVHQFFEQNPTKYIQILEENFKKVCRNLQEEEIKRKRLEKSIKNITQQLNQVSQQSISSINLNKESLEQYQQDQIIVPQNIQVQEINSNYNIRIENINQRYQNLSSRESFDQKVGKEKMKSFKDLLTKENTKEAQQPSNQCDCSNLQTKITQLQRKNLTRYSANVALQQKINQLQSELLEVKAQLSKKDEEYKIKQENQRDQLKAQKIICQQLQAQIKDLQNQNEGLSKKASRVNELRVLNQNLEIKNKQLNEKIENMIQRRQSKTPLKQRITVNSSQNKSQECKVNKTQSFSLKKQSNEMLLSQLESLVQKNSELQEQIKQQIFIQQKF